MKDKCGRKEVVASLIKEVLDGKTVRDTLPEDAFRFNGEVMAMYYSAARRNMQSETAQVVMYRKTLNTCWNSATD